MSDLKDYFKGLGKAGKDIGRAIAEAPKPTRTFDGLVYELEGVYDRKSKAKNVKKRFKDRGAGARVTKAAKKRDGNWEVWISM